MAVFGLIKPKNVLCTRPFSSLDEASDALLFDALFYVNV